MSTPEILLMLVLGLVVGSFLNVVVYRLPRMLEGVEEATLSFPDRKSTRLNSSHIPLSRMPSSA